jgi:uncharacterized membrane protein YgcG
LSAFITRSIHLSLNRDLSTEDFYRLTQWDSNPDAQSDTLITIRSPAIGDQLRLYAFTFTDPELMQHAFWSTKTLEFSIIAFAGEFKRVDATENKNQLIMVLSTAQRQRKALLLEDSIIMGATSCRGLVRIYSSYWSLDPLPVVCIHEHKQEFDLKNPINVIHMYLFLVKLERSFKKSVIPKLEQYVRPTEVQIKDHLWRSPDRIKQQRKKRKFGSASNDCDGMGSGSGSRRDDDSYDGNRDGGPWDEYRMDGGGGGGSGGGGGGEGRGGGGGSRSHGKNDNTAVMNESGDDPEWNMQVAAWKTEAHEGAKEASLISGEGESLTGRHLRQFTTSDTA